MRIDVVTIFPEMFPGFLDTSMVRIARERGLLEVNVHDLRDWAHDRHRTTDDYPYGGGPGMVMKPEPVFEAVDAIQSVRPEHATVVFLTPAGQVFDQSSAEALSREGRILLVCGRYEGFDERCLSLADIELSIGDYVLTGGELPAMVVIDAVARLIPGVLGHEASAADESFSEGLLEYPQYTRPPVYRGMEVPSVLVSGDHAAIAAWRREQSIRRTTRVRPDLLARTDFTADQRPVARKPNTGGEDAEEGLADDGA